MEKESIEWAWGNVIPGVSLRSTPRLLMLSPLGFGEGEGVILFFRGCRVRVLGWGFPWPRWGQGERKRCSFFHAAASFGGWVAWMRWNQGLIGTLWSAEARMGKPVETGWGS